MNGEIVMHKLTGADAHVLSEENANPAPDPEAPHWRDCAEFCAKYDQNGFDPDYDSMTLGEFEPMVQSAFATARNSIYLTE